MICNSWQGWRTALQGKCVQRCELHEEQENTPGMSKLLMSSCTSLTGSKWSAQQHETGQKDPGEGRILQRKGVGGGDIPASKCPAHACDAVGHPPPRFRPAEQLCTEEPPLLRCTAGHRCRHEAAGWHRLHGQTRRPQRGAWPLLCP